MLYVMIVLLISNTCFASFSSKIADKLIPKLDPSDSNGGDGGNHRT